MPGLSSCPVKSVSLGCGGGVLACIFLTRCQGDSITAWLENCRSNQEFSKGGPRTSGVSLTCELTRNASYHPCPSESGTLGWPRSLLQALQVMGYILKSETHCCHEEGKACSPFAFRWFQWLPLAMGCEHRLFYVFSWLKLLIAGLDLSFSQPCTLCDSNQNVTHWCLC